MDRKLAFALMMLNLAALSMVASCNDPFEIPAPEVDWCKIIDPYSAYEGSMQQTNDSGYIIASSHRLIKTDSFGNQLWTRAFDENNTARSVQQTSDGRYIITGRSSTGNGNLWLTKADSNGKKIWGKTFGGTKSDEGYSVQQTTDDGYIIVGSTESYGDGGKDVWLIKTDLAGNKVWDKTFGGPGTELGYSVQQTNDGGYIIAGNGISLIKTDSSGKMLWEIPTGETGADYCASVQQTTDGGYVVTGTTYSYDAGSGDIFLIKTDSSGKKLWNESFGGKDREWGHSVLETADGGYIILGQTGSYPGMGFMLIKVKPRCTLYYPDFSDTIDTTDPESYRSLFVIQNPTVNAAYVHIEIMARSGDVLYEGSSTIPARGGRIIRPSTLVGADCVGSAIVSSDQPIVGTCRLIRNNDEMGMIYTAIES